MHISNIFTDALIDLYVAQETEVGFVFLFNTQFLISNYHLLIMFQLFNEYNQ